jgi:hypothetical protein
MNFSNKTLRTILRAIHLVIGGLVIAHLYTPLGTAEWFGSLVKISLPILTITGVLMWQMPLFTKIIKRQPVPKQI